jgi:hypothetical protein
VVPLVGVGVCYVQEGERAPTGNIVGVGVWVSKCDKTIIIWSAWTGVTLREGSMVGAGGVGVE